MKKILLRQIIIRSCLPSILEMDPNSENFYFRIFLMFNVSILMSLFISNLLCIENYTHSTKRRSNPKLDIKALICHFFTKTGKYLLGTLTRILFSLCFRPTVDCVHFKNV